MECKLRATLCVLSSAYLPTLEGEKVMSDVNENQSVDMAVILEGRIKERVDETVTRLIEPLIRRAVSEYVAVRFAAEKETMLLEIATTMGKILGQAQEENRKALWEYTPEELNLTPEMLGQAFGNPEFNPPKEPEDAIRKQT